MVDRIIGYIRELISVARQRNNSINRYSECVPTTGSLRSVRVALMFLQLDEVVMRMPREVFRDHTGVMLE